MTINIDVSPLKSYFWEEIEHIKIDGLDPFQLYHLELTLKHRTLFISRAHFFADEDGTIDLARDAPVFGMYDKADKMGLFTSLYTHPSEKLTAKLNLSPLPESLIYTLTLYFHDTRKKLKEVQVERILMHKNIKREPINHPQLEGVLYLPKTRENRPIPCVIDMYGAAMGTREHRAVLLASEGYCVLALAIFGTGKLSKNHEDITSEYLQIAVDYITELPFTEDKCGIVGTSFGGTLAYHTLFKKEQVSCAVSINGQRGHYLVSQLNENGEKLPFAPVMPDNMPHIKYHNGFISYATMYGSCELDDEQMLKFEHIRDHQKLMYVSGGEDRAIDGTAQGREISKIVENMKRRHQFTLLELPQCGHVIDPPYMPVNDFLYQGGRYLAFGGEPYTHGLGQHRAWKEILTFLKKNLGNPVNMEDNYSKL